MLLLLATFINIGIVSRARTLVGKMAAPAGVLLANDIHVRSIQAKRGSVVCLFDCNQLLLESPEFDFLHEHLLGQTRVLDHYVLEAFFIELTLPLPTHL